MQIISPVDSAYEAEVKVKCNNMTLKGKDGEEAELMNGMACQAKIIVDEKNVLTYLLEKIDLLD
jgi:hypothetical protein